MRPTFPSETSLCRATSEKVNVDVHSARALEPLYQMYRLNDFSLCSCQLVTTSLTAAQHKPPNVQYSKQTENHFNRRPRAETVGGKKNNLFPTSTTFFSNMVVMVIQLWLVVDTCVHINSLDSATRSPGDVTGSHLLF